MKKITFFFFNCFVLLGLNAQDFSAEFTKALRDNDTLLQQKILSLWEKSTNRSADYYICNFNYNINMASINNILICSQKPNNKEYIIFKDSLDNIAGYISDKGLNSKLLKNGIKYIDEGINKYPNRLDMRFGKIYALYRAWLWDEYTNEIIKTIDYSHIIDNKWIYPEQNANKNFFLSTIQSYIIYLFDETDLEKYSKADSMQVIRIRKISEEVLKYYPDNVEALSNIGATYFFNLDYSKALEYFTKAEKINPKDTIVLFNIANVYAKQGNKEKAKQYYENIIQNCDKQAAQQAKELMKQL